MLQCTISGIMLSKCFPVIRTAKNGWRFNSITAQCRHLSMKGKRITSIRIDRSGLLGNGRLDEDDSLSTEDIVDKEDPSPLTKDLQSYIKLRGPITIHDYMAQSLNHVPHGYYQHKLEKIGSAGDFITAPEVSQLFGEMVGVWCLSVWEALGRPAKVQLVEMGPGKGTLMVDILRVVERFPAFKSSLSVHMVELSQSMRRLQCDALIDADATKTSALSGEEPIINDNERRECASGVPVHWHSFLQQVAAEDGVPLLAVGQEFLDAFPVHQFAFTSRGWREKLVDVDTSARSPYHFRLVLAPNPTPATLSLLDGERKDIVLTSPAEDQLKRAPGKLVLPTVQNIDSVTAALDALAATAAAGLKEVPRQNSVRLPADTPISGGGAAASGSQLTPSAYKEGDGLEICPLAIATCEDLARRVVRSGGAALLVDYGEDFTQEDSLRGFHKHKQVSVLSQPGRVDVTADVDFAVCRRAAVNRGATVPPLSTQGDFLMRMGVVERVERLMERESTSEAQAELLVESLGRLVDPAEMGRKFKVLAICSPGLAVPGFADSSSSQ